MTVRRPIHPKVTGGAVGGLIAGLVTAELTRRLHLTLLPEEIAGIEVLAGFAGGWLARAGP